MKSALYSELDVILAEIHSLCALTKVTCNFNRKISLFRLKLHVTLVRPQSEWIPAKITCNFK